MQRYQLKNARKSGRKNKKFVNKNETMEKLQKLISAINEIKLENQGVYIDKDEFYKIVTNKLDRIYRLVEAEELQLSTDNQN